MTPSFYAYVLQAVFFCGFPHQNPAGISLIQPWIIHAAPI